MSTPLLKYVLYYSILRIVSATTSSSFVGDVIQRSEQFRNFSNVVVFVGGGTDLREVNEILRSVNPNIHAATYIFTSSADDEFWNLLRNHIKDDALSIVFCNSQEDDIWRIVDRRLRKLRQGKMVVVFAADTKSPQMVEDIFKKLWKLQFLQVALLHEETIYSYTPYPRITIFEIGKQRDCDVFPPVQKDLKGYKISVPVENDIPRIFFVTDHLGATHLRGFAYQIFTHFLRRLNISLEILNPDVVRPITSSVNMSNIVHRIGMQQLEISMHPYTGINERKGIMSYPIFKVENCLIIPVQNEIPRSMYLLHPFEWRSWVLIAIASIYVAIVLVWTSPCVEHVGRAPFHEKLSRTFLESIAQLLFLSSTFQRYRPKWRYFVVYLQLAIMGFFVTSWYCNLLSSYFATILVGEQADTIEALIASKIRILVKYYEVHLLLEHVAPHLVKKVGRLVVAVNASDQISQLLSFNTSFSYPVTAERWTFLALQQQYANKPIYRYSRICFGSPCVGYPVRLDSHLEHHLMRFIMDVQMAGLDHYWLVSDFRDALRAGYVRLIDNVLPFKALDLYTLSMAWYLIVCGWLIAAITFMVEFYACMS